MHGRVKNPLPRGFLGGKRFGKEPWGPVPVTSTVGTFPDPAVGAQRTGWDALRWECLRSQAGFPGLGVTVNEVEGS